MFQLQQSLSVPIESEAPSAVRVPKRQAIQLPLLPEEVHSQAPRDGTPAQMSQIDSRFGKFRFSLNCVCYIVIFANLKFGFIQDSFNVHFAYASRESMRVLHHSLLRRIGGSKSLMKTCVAQVKSDYHKGDFCAE